MKPTVIAFRMAFLTALLLLGLALTAGLHLTACHFPERVPV